MIKRILSKEYLLLPITGPINGSYTVTLPSGDTVYQVWSRYSQAKPYNLPLPYWKGRKRTFMARSFCNVPGGNCRSWYNATVSPSANGNVSGGCGPFDTSNSSTLGSLQEVTIALNGAIESFRGEIGSKCEAMVNAIQYNQALDMVRNASTRLYRFTRAVKRGRFREAKNIISPGGGHGGLYEVRDVAGAWLYYSYGVKPLVQDIYTGIDIVTRTAVHRIEAKEGIKKVRIDRRGQYTYTTGTPGKWYNAGYVRGKCGGIVEITNPNAFLASSLGLTNPVSWVWESIPFSFVVDWFVNLGDVLATMCPDLGFKVKDPWSMYYVNVLCSGETRFQSSGLIPAYLNNQYATVEKQTIALGRATAIPQVKLVAPLGVLTSLPRALNAASLLAVLLKSK